MRVKCITIETHGGMVFTVLESALEQLEIRERRVYADDSTSRDAKFRNLVTNVDYEISMRFILSSLDYQSAPAHALPAESVECELVEDHPKELPSR